MSAIRSPRVIVDERERNSGIPELLRSAGALVEFAHLKVGDYIVSSETAVERKTVHDLVNSIYDGRLLIQCSELRTHFPRPLLLIQGDFNELELSFMEESGNEADSRKMKRLAERLPLAYDSIADVALNFGIPILHTSTAEQATQLLISLINQSFKAGFSRGPLLRKIKKDNPILLQQLSVLTSVPGVGEKLAERMLEKFSTPTRALNASAAELATIPGFGLARAERVRKVLDTPAGKKAKEGTATYQSKLSF